MTLTTEAKEFLTVTDLWCLFSNVVYYKWVILHYLGSTYCVKMEF